MTQLQENCKGVILCGGPSTGTVFRPLSMTLPKPLFPLAGHPMIRHHVEALSKVVSQVFLIGFFEESLFSPLIKQLSVDFPNISVRYLREFQSLGSAGCLFHFRDQILAHGTTSFYVLNADICCSFPLDRLNNLHNEHQQVGTILSMRMDRKFVHKYGCIVPSTGAANKHQVMHFVEKPESFISVYLFEPSIFDVIQQVGDDMRIKAKEDGCEPPSKIGLEKNVLTFLAAQQNLNTLILDPLVDFWRQIKTGSSVIPANQVYLQNYKRSQSKQLSSNNGNLNVSPAELLQPVIIDSTASVDPSAKIGPNVMIGPRVVIGKGVRIKNSIILDDVVINHDSCIINTVVGWKSKIGAWSRVEGSPEDATHLNATYKGLKIPTATILGEDVCVSDEIIVRNCIVLPHKVLDASYHNEVLM